MLSLLPEDLPTSLAIFALISPVLLFLATWVVSRLSAHRSRDGEPPMIPYTIPWLGHAYLFLSNMNGFASWVRNEAPDRDVSTTLIAGKHMYCVFDPNLVSMIYRRSRSFTYHLINLSFYKVFGTPKEDLDVMKIGLPGIGQGFGDKDDGLRIYAEIHHQFAENLTGKRLVQMVSKFTEGLTINLKKPFINNGTFEVSDDWIKLDLCSFFKKQLLLAALPSLFGSHLMEIWPDAYEDFFDFDKHSHSLLMNLPRILSPTAFVKRDQILSVLGQWEDDAYKCRDFQSLEMLDPDWDEYWGARLMRVRHRTFLKNGISKAGRCAIELGMMWGQNSNAIPVGVWMLVQCICDIDLQHRVRAAIALYQKQDGTFDLDGLVTNRLLKSIFLESLRFSVAVPLMRMVLETTELGGYTFHKGNLIYSSSRELQMDARAWSTGEILADPSNFWAERFLNLEKNEDVEEERVAEALEANAQVTIPAAAENTSKSHGRSKASMEPTSLPGSRSKLMRERMQFMRPFGGGVSLCPGRHFAMYETIAGLAIILSMFEFEVDKEMLRLNGMPRPDLSVLGGMAPDRKLMVKMRRR